MSKTVQDIKDPHRLHLDFAFRYSWCSCTFFAKASKPWRMPAGTVEVCFECWACWPLKILKPWLSLRSSLRKFWTSEFRNISECWTKDPGSTNGRVCLMLKHVWIHGGKFPQQESLECRVLCLPKNGIKVGRFGGFISWGNRILEQKWSLPGTARNVRATAVAAFYVGSMLEATEPTSKWFFS